MDGNRRYSEKQNISLTKGYELGMTKFLELISFQVKYNVKQTSFFALSTDNYEKRPQEEISILFKLIKQFSENKDIDKFFMENKIKLNLIGDIDYIEKKETKKDKSKKKVFQEFKKQVASRNEKLGEGDFIVNLAINYGGQKEILHSFKEILEKVKLGELKENKITEETIKENLWFKSEPAQVIVRCGDAPRLSGFMLFDSAYSEIYLTKKLWPELDESDFVLVLNWYKNLKRNFGK
jgi:undecaprenyl diphosphate synthase